MTEVEGRKKQSKSAVAYEHPAEGMHHCSECTHFRKPNQCVKVQGIIQPEDWCKLFKERR